MPADPFPVTIAFGQRGLIDALDVACHAEGESAAKLGYGQDETRVLRAETSTAHDALIDELGRLNGVVDRLQGAVVKYASYATRKWHVREAEGHLLPHDLEPLEMVWPDERPQEEGPV